MATPEITPDTIQWRNLLGACAAITIFGFALGELYPLLALVLEQRGYSEEIIGINAAMSPLGILASAPAIPYLSRRFGAQKVAIAAAAVAATSLLFYRVFDNLPAWFALRFVHGMTVSILFVLSESWVVRFSGRANRGTIVAIYATVLAASFGAGPAVVGFTGIDGWLPFVIGAVILYTGIIPLMLVRDDNTSQAGPASSLWKFLPKAPVLLGAVAAFAMFDASTMSLFPVYGLRTGLDQSTAAFALTAMIMGNVVLQVPIGWLADRTSKRAMLAACAVVVGGLCLTLPFIMGGAMMWLVLPLTGAAAYGMYTVALADLGDRFSGNELIAGTSSFATMWGIGAMTGALISGWAMNVAGPHGLPYSLAAAAGLFVLAMAGRALYTGRK